MKYVYVGAVLAAVGFTFGCSSDDSSAQSIAGKHRVDQLDREAYLEKMNIIQGDLEYKTYCLKGKRVIYSDRNMFYELDDLGHPIPCDVK